MGLSATQGRRGDATHGGISRAAGSCPESEDLSCLGQFQGPEGSTTRGGGFDSQGSLPNSDISLTVQLAAGRWVREWSRRWDIPTLLLATLLFVSGPYQVDQAFDQVIFSRTKAMRRPAATTPYNEQKTAVALEEISQRELRIVAFLMSFVVAD